MKIALFIYLLVFSIGFFYIRQRLPEYVHNQANENSLALENTISLILGNASSDLEKFEAVYQWVNESVKSTYGQKILFKISPVNVLWDQKNKEILPCIRLVGFNDPLWIISGRCGACSEKSQIFRELANAANLTARSIHNAGEDHNWDEFFLNGEWILVDATGTYPFNFSKEYFKSKMKRSYLFAQYPNGTREDVTREYVNVTPVTVSVLFENKSVENATVLVYSNYLKNRDEAYTYLNCSTDALGTCLFELGHVDITFKVSKTLNKTILKGETTMNINSTKDIVTVIVNLNEKHRWKLFEKINENWTYLIFCWMLFLNVVLYSNQRKNKNNKISEVKETSVI